MHFKNCHIASILLRYFQCNVEKRIWELTHEWVVLTYLFEGLWLDLIFPGLPQAASHQSNVEIEMSNLLTYAMHILSEAKKLILRLYEIIIGSTSLYVGRIQEVHKKLLALVLPSLSRNIFSSLEGFKNLQYAYCIAINLHTYSYFSSAQNLEHTRIWEALRLLERIRSPRPSRSWWSNICDIL